MTTYGTMYARITTELDRTTADDTAAAKREIFSAIDQLRYHRFWWNEKKFTITTTNGTDEYAYPTADTDAAAIIVLEIDDLIINRSNYLYSLTKKPYVLLDGWKASTSSKSAPNYWAPHHEKIRLYPIPDATYTITGSGLVDINTLTTASGDASTNAWFTFGEELVRSLAKAKLCANVYRDVEQASDHLSIHQGILRNLMRGRDAKLMPAGAVPWE